MTKAIKDLITSVNNSGEMVIQATLLTNGVESNLTQTLPDIPPCGYVLMFDTDINGFYFEPLSDRIKSSYIVCKTVFGV